MTKSINLWLLLIAMAVFAVVVYILLSQGADPPELADIKAKIAQYAKVNIKADLSSLTDKQKEVLKLLIEAAKLNDTIFWKQASRVGLEDHKILMDSGRSIDNYYLEYLNINYGPFDRLDGDKLFYGTETRKAGAAFYPDDMTKEEFNKYIEEHPEQRDALISPYTIVERTADGKLRAIPYSEAYKEETKEISDFLMKASEIAENLSLKAYLKAKAQDFLKDNFYESDTLWLKMEGNIIDLVIGPQEVYEDGLFNYKASHEAFVMVKDVKASRSLDMYNDHKNAMEINLPVTDNYKKEYKGLSSPLSSVQMVYCTGSPNAGTKTIAFNLPNDERVREETGSKKVLLKNVIEAKYEKILQPIAEILLDPSLMKYLSKEAFSTNVLMHEFSHAFGLNYTVNDPAMTIKNALGANYSTIEECKADVIGLYNENYFFKKGIINLDNLKTYQTTFIASIFRSIRFGVHEAHGGANLIQFNFLKDHGAIIYNEQTGKYSIDFEKLDNGIAGLAEIILKIQGDGDAAAAEALIEKYGKMTPDLEKGLEKLKAIPVDIVFFFEFDF